MYHSVFARFFFLKYSAYRRTDETNSFRVKMKLTKKSKILPPLSHKQKIKHVTRGRPFSKKKKRPKTIPSFRGKGTLRPEGIGFFHGMEWMMKEKVPLEDHYSLRDMAALLHVKESPLRYYKIMKVGDDSYREFQRHENPRLEKIHKQRSAQKN